MQLKKPTPAPRTVTKERSNAAKLRRSKKNNKNSTKKPSTNMSSRNTYTQLGNYVASMPEPIIPTPFITGKKNSRLNKAMNNVKYGVNL